MAATCPNCAAPRGDELECARCGIVFARAHAGDVSRPPHLPPESPTWSGELDDALLELRLRTWAVPSALVLAWLAVRGGLHSAIRIFLSMWVHESGHAVAAWFCGYPALPGP